MSAEDKKTNRKRFRVEHRGDHLTVYPWFHTPSGKWKWRFGWKNEDGKWAEVTRATKDKAIAAAEAKLREGQVDRLEWESLPRERQRFLERINREVKPDEEDALFAFLGSRRRSAEVVISVGRFMDGKISEAGEETPYLKSVRGILEGMASHFRGRAVSEIHLPDLMEWCTERGKGLSGTRRSGIRADLVQFWRWALRDGIAGNSAVTVAERLPKIAREDTERRVLTPAEFQAIVDNIGEEWRAWAVLGAFAGLRPEEIAPSKVKKKGKRGLHCEEIDWTFKVIRIPACVSKVNRPRIVPLSEACVEGLRWAGIKPGMTGPLVLRNPSQAHELLRLGKLIFKEVWPQDALRHSYGSYRNAVIRNLAQVAEEMGTSESMLHRHYHNPKAEGEGTAWFSWRPPVLISSDFPGVETKNEESGKLRKSL